MIRVLLADDEPLIRAGLRMLINIEPDLSVVGEAGDGTQTIEAVARLRPHVVLMDVRMPGLDGVEVTRHVTGAGVADDSAPAVLILTTFHDDGAVHAALRAGASGFLLKHAAPRWLPDAIRSVAGGDAWLDPSVTRRLLADFAVHSPPHLPGPGELECLTAREREVLVLAAHGMTNAAIANHLVISEATVRTHVGRSMAKLGLHDRAQLVATAYRSGALHPRQPLPGPRSVPAPGSW